MLITGLLSFNPQSSVLNPQFFLCPYAGKPFPESRRLKTQESLIRPVR